ncbi:hypothetical protein EGR_05497 [Echinococcus granulosus]|uniref:Uncharacterized protein n=1 Tax=Echinococcus granulosus TaxID=6210 RepID=W6UEV5_ECHGR|nr:hypothetical protein EGR_05497 [Echinococcus granulosus]EUB59598.1 hypothetical protein EGR_05497 [Echinococcus granulosus]
MVNEFSFAKVFHQVAGPEHVHTSEFRMTVCLYVRAWICAELQVFPPNVNSSKKTNLFDKSAKKGRFLYYSVVGIHYFAKLFKMTYILLIVNHFVNVVGFLYCINPRIEFMFKTEVNFKRSLQGLQNRDSFHSDRDECRQKQRKPR